ncbi:UNVERIFIED_CONTAM: hypothetical protein K2H54_045616 [Gekko kuhli]
MLRAGLGMAQGMLSEHRRRRQSGVPAKKRLHTTWASQQLEKPWGEMGWRGVVHRGRRGHTPLSPFSGCQRWWGGNEDGPVNQQRSPHRTRASQQLEKGQRWAGDMRHTGEGEAAGHPALAAAAEAGWGKDGLVMGSTLGKDMGDGTPPPGGLPAVLECWRARECHRELGPEEGGVTVASP